MKARNLYVFLLGGIYLSLVPEMFALPVTKKPQPPRKDYRYFMNLLGRAPPRISLNFKPTVPMSTTVKKTTKGEGHKTTKGEDEVTQKTAHKNVTFIEKSTDKSTEKHSDKSDEKHSDKISEKDSDKSTVKHSEKNTTDKTTVTATTKKPAVTSDMSKFFLEAKKKLSSTTHKPSITTARNNTVDKFFTKSTKKVHSIAPQFLHEVKKKTTKSATTTKTTKKSKEKGKEKSASKEKSKEKTAVTINVQKLLKDQEGKWLYNPFVVTLGNQLYDKNGPQHLATERHRVKVEANKKKFYNPDAKMATVCMGTTIPYGDQKIMGWIDRHVYKKKHKKRVFYMDLRRDMYAMSHSELCHNKNMRNWMDYQECSMRRNQRLEAFVPQYPMQ